MKTLGIIFVVIVGFYLLKSTSIFKASASTGNPNYPPSQDGLSIGPQGPNDGSNNYGGSGHTMIPIFAEQAPAQQIYSRGFAYTGTRTYPGAVQIQTAVY